MRAGSCSKVTTVCHCVSLYVVGVALNVSGKETVEKFSLKRYLLRALS